MKNSKAQKARDLAIAKFEAGDYPRNLLSQNSKTLKSEKTHTEFIQYGLQLAPAKMSGHNLCPYSTPECERDCLAFSGHGSEPMHEEHQKFNPIWAGWVLKALIYKNDRDWFFGKLLREIDVMRAKTFSSGNKLSGKKLVIRLNVTSDIVWEKQRISAQAFHMAGMLMPGTEATIFDVFPDVQFIDYTKIPGRYRSPPANYHLLLSYTGHNYSDCAEYLEQGGTVAAVFTSKPTEYLGFPVIDGDKHDLRQLDPEGVWVGLKPKGTLLKNIDDNPFVIHPVEEGGWDFGQTG